MPERVVVAVDAVGDGAFVILLVIDLRHAASGDEIQRRHKRDEEHEPHECDLEFCFHLLSFPLGLKFLSV